MAGTFGNCGRDNLLGPRQVNIDISAMKDFRIAEGHALQFRAELFNALDHAHFSNPSGSFTSGNFGRVTSAKAGRIGQRSLKFLW